MKRNVIFFIFFSLVLFLFFIFRFGIQIGNVRIGKQVDLRIKQEYDYKNSEFYKNSFSKENLIVLNLWATWCKPCIEEFPDLNLLKEKYESKPIDFLSFSIDQDSVKLVNFLETGKIKFKDITIDNLEYRTAIINLLENRTIDKHIYTYTVPKTFVIKNKKVLKVFNGQVDINEIEKLIKSNQ